LNGERLPKINALKAEWQTLSTANGMAIVITTAQKDMREVLAVKAIINHLLGLTARDINKEQER
jgi:hypothetical protein